MSKSSCPYVLLLDSGNSRLKLRVIEFSTARTLAQFALDNSNLNQLSAHLSPYRDRFQQVIGVAVSSVTLKATIAQYLQPLMIVNQEIEWLQSAPLTLALHNVYVDYRELGNDRWFGLLGVYSIAQSPAKPLLYISFGTATTVDTIVGDSFIGGVILPGLELMQSSLKQGTARLPLVEIEAGHALEAFPRSTQGAIRNGILAAQSGAIMRQCLQIFGQYGQLPAVFVSGGARHAVLAELQQMIAQLSQSLHLPPMRVQQIDAPVLDGLHYYYKESFLGN